MDQSSLIEKPGRNRCANSAPDASRPRQPGARTGGAATAAGRLAALLAACGLLAACVSAPAPLQGDYAELQPTRATDADLGREVRWGGVVLATHAGAQETCFEVLSHPLDRALRPDGRLRSQGRFLACKDGFHDPEVFDKGRELTLTGRLDSFETRKVDEYYYRYPVVEAEFVTLWPERPAVRVVRRYEPYPVYGWWGPYYRPLFHHHYRWHRYWHRYPYW